jgi:hypothetical protein
LLNSDNILHGGQQVGKDKHVSKEDLEDMETSPAVPSEAVATKEHHVVWGDILPINPTSPFHNKSHVQFGENRAPTHCDVLPSRMDEVHLEVNARVLGMGSINP